MGREKGGTAVRGKRRGRKTLPGGKRRKAWMLQYDWTTFSNDAVAPAGMETIVFPTLQGLCRYLGATRAQVADALEEGTALNGWFVDETDADP